MIELARENRKKPTEAEAVMWNLLRNYFTGVRFRRQHPIAEYIADFACLSKKLIIEIDGEYHFEREQINEDRNRTIALNGKGFTVIRFTNEEVLNDTENVLMKIRKFIIKEQI